jgi:hypothetical protein
MCTLTIVPLEPTGFRLAFNRDESRRRPRALAPAVSRRVERTCLHPIDPQGGGTWIGVNDTGLVAALLNVYPGPADALLAAPAPRASRGEIVPRLLEAATLEQAAAFEPDPRRYPPFRVVLCHDGRIVDLTSDGSSITRRGPQRLIAPELRTSSGLGDVSVEGPRRALFEKLLASVDSVGAQDAFHRHSWIDRPDISVCMRRSEAATVSLSILDVDPRLGQTLFLYQAGPPDEDGARVAAILELTRGR